MIHVDVHKSAIHITQADGNQLQPLLPGLRSKTLGRGEGFLFTCPATAFHFDRLSKLRCEYTEDAARERKFLWERRALFVQLLKITRHGSYGDYSPFELFMHQAQAVDAIGMMGHRILLGDEMGLGKTQVAISCFRLSGSPRLLVVCPATIKMRWKRELEGNGIGAYVIGREWHVENNPAAAIVNYDILSRRPGLVEQLAILVEDAFLILDESHYVKDTSAKRTKAVQKFKPRHVLLLTGTPVRNSIVDLYSQVSMVEKYWRGQYEFEDRYLIKKPKYLGNRVIWEPVGTKNESELQEILSHVQIRRLKKEVLDLPEKIYSRVDLELDEEARKAYEQMRDRWLYHFDGLPRELSILDQRARSAVEAALRLEQIAQGFLSPIPETFLEHMDRQGLVADLPESNTQSKAFKTPAKLEWLEELYGDLKVQKRKLVVFYRFNATLRMAHQRLGGSWMTGQTPAAERQEIIQAFQNRDDVDLFHCQIKIAEGFDLTAAQDVVFYGRDWSPAVNAQAEDRLHRIGQRGTVNVFQPVVLGTVEEYMARRLEDKGNTAALVLGDLRDAVMQGSPKKVSTQNESRSGPVSPP